MNTKWHKASIGIAVLLALVLVVGVLPHKAAYAEDGEGDTWETLMAQFQELTRKQAYAILDKEFSQFSGTGIEPIQKTTKMLEVIETLGNLATYYENVIGATPSQKANLEFLEGLAAGLVTAAGLVPLPVVGDFFQFYAAGIRAAVNMMGDLSDELREKAIMIAKLADLDFSLYPGAISDEQIRAIKRMEAEEWLARRARGAVLSKKRHLEDKLLQIEWFVCEDPGWGYSDFITRVVEKVQSQAGQDGGWVGSELDWMLWYLKAKDCPLVFEITEPRDAMEQQYSMELANLMDEAKDTTTQSRAYLPILRNASSTCRCAEGVLYRVRYILGYLEDGMDDTPIKATIAEVRQKINGLTGKAFSYEGDVTTYEGALARFQQIKDDYAGVQTEAEGIRTEAEAVLAQAQSFVEEVKGAWEGKVSEEVGVPYSSWDVVDLPAELSADDVSQAILGLPRTAQPHIVIDTAVAESVIEDVWEVWQWVPKPFYRFSEGPKLSELSPEALTMITIEAEPSGIVSTSLEEISALKAGGAAITVSTYGLLQAPSFRTRYTPEEYAELARGEITKQRSVVVYEFVGIEFDPSTVDLFVPASEWDSTEGSEWDSADGKKRVKATCNFIGVTPFKREPPNKNTLIESSDWLAVSIDEDISWGLFPVVAGEPGQATVTFHIVDDLGNKLHGEGLTVTSNKVRVLADFYSLEDVPLEVTEDGFTVYRIYAWVHAGEIMELKVAVEGPVDMSNYECYWSTLRSSIDMYPELEYLMTDFAGQSSTNYLKVPADTKPNTSYRLKVKVYSWENPSWPVFDGAVPGIQVKTARLNSVLLYTAFAQDEPILIMNELHMFTSRTGYQAEVEIFPEGYFTDELNNDITKEVYRTKEYGDAVGNFHNHTDLLYNPSVLSVKKWVAENDYYQSISAVNPGSCYVFSISWAYEGAGAVYIHEDKGYLRSGNVIKVYVDPMRLGGPYDRKVASGETLRLKLNVETEGDLTDYECVWSLSTDVGVLESEVTEFIKGENENWYSENQWAVPADQEGQEVHMEAVIRLKGSEKALGKDATIATIVSPLPGDVNSDGDVSLADAILALKVLCGLDTTGESLRVSADVNGDGKIGLEEVVYILKKVSR